MLAIIPAVMMFQLKVGVRVDAENWLLMLNPPGFSRKSGNHFCGYFFAHSTTLGTMNFRNPWLLRKQLPEL